MLKKLFLFIVAAPLLAFALWGAKIYYLLDVWQYEGEDTVFQVRRGENFPSINARLGKANLISSRRVFHRYAQYKGVMTKFRHGSYLIPRNTNMLELMDILLYGKAITKKVTIAEGKNLYQIAQILELNGLVTYSNFVNTAKDPQLMRTLGIPADTVEGYLYPETYQFPLEIDSQSVIEIMVSQSKKHLKSLGLEFGSKQAHSVVTLASIVEKETGAAFERPMIAGVFLNRLKKNMRLQSDPTTIYGIYEDYKGNITKKHLQQKTDYNTYKMAGLPKGPISNPGHEALNAVLNPAKHDYLYFVSKNNGTHIFSTSYRDHSKAVREYQKSRAKRTGRSWRDMKK